MSRDALLVRRRLSMALWSAFGFAVLGLPASEIPAVWIAAMTLPVLFFVVFPCSGRMPFWIGAVLALGLQITAVLTAYAATGPLDKAATLAVTLLPPLAYVCAMRRDADAPFVLLVSFCLLFIGILLHGKSDWLCLVGFLVSAALTLRLDSRFQLLSSGIHERVRIRGPSMAIANAGLLALACGLLSLGIYQLLLVLPRPERQSGSSTLGTSTNGRREVGLSENFVLSSDSGSGPVLRPDRLVRVKTGDGSPVPNDLYLRYTFFDLPGLETWRRTPARPQAIDTSQQQWDLKRIVPGVPVHSLEIERLETLRGMVFVPPGAVAILGIANLRGMRRAGWYWQAMPDGPIRYDVAYQDLRGRARRLRTDPRYRSLKWLPRELRTGRLREIADELLPTGVNCPAEVARRLAIRLGQRCKYALVDPIGNYDNALLNFLDGNRRGYCMHFASAMAILLRMAGIPARIGVGVCGGEPDPDHGNARLYGSQHGHAWVEIPFEGLGWVVFDPTPTAHRGTGSNAPELTAGPSNDPEAPSEADTSPSIVAILARIWPWSSLLLVWFLIQWGPRRGRGVVPGVPATVLRPARRLLAKLLSGLASAGYRRAPGQSLESFLARLGGNGDRQAIADAFAAYQELRFGARTFDEARRERLERGVAAARVWT